MDPRTIILPNGEEFFDDAYDEFSNGKDDENGDSGQPPSSLHSLVS